MSVLELKGGILEIVSRLEDEHLLTELYELAESTMQKEMTIEDTFSLTQEQVAELNLAEAESFDENELIDHDVVRAKHQQWLAK